MRRRTLNAQRKNRAPLAIVPLERRLLLSGTLLSVYSFTNGNQFAPSDAPIAVDPAGDIFGTTGNAGAANAGSVFELPAGNRTLQTLGSFPGFLGYQAVGQLTIDANGDVFGVLDGFTSGGSVYEIVAGSGTVTTLASFPTANGTALSAPDSGVVMDASGNLYGTTDDGGANQDGAIFELAKGSSTPTLLASFTEKDTSGNHDGLALDKNGNLFGVSEAGGTHNDGYLWELANGSNSITELSFNGTNGSNPYGRPVVDQHGNVFGTIKSGLNTYGGVYEVAKGSTTIQTVASCTPFQGIQPIGGLAIDAAGNLFGTTGLGGANTSGEVFELPAGTLNGTITPLASFDGSQGGVPPSALSFDGAGNLYGRTNFLGANNFGAVYELPAVGSVDQLAFGTPTHGTGGGLSLSVPVSLRNSGSTVTTGSSNVTISILTGPGTLSGTTTLQLVNGVGTLSNLHFSAPGTYTLQASTTDLFNGIAINAGQITVTPGLPTRLAFLQQPSSTVAGTAIPAMTVAVQDAYGESVSSTNGTVTLSVKTGPGTPVGDLTVTPVGGVATFSNITFTSAGNYTLAASDTSDSLTSALSNSFTVSAAAPAQLVFLQAPAAATAGTVLVPAVQVAIEDAYSNIITSASSILTIATNTGPAAVEGNLSVAAVHGVAAFAGLLFNTAGNYTLAVSDADHGLSAASGNFTVSASTASRLTFTQQPTTVSAGVGFGTQVLVTDAHNNPISGNVTLSIASGPAGGFLAGAIQVQTVNGVADFSNLTLSKPGAYTLIAVMGSVAADSATIQVGTGPTHLGFIQAPARVLTAGKSFSASVDVLDAQNHPVATSGSTVSVTLLGTAGGALLGTTAATVVNGVATFNNLAIQKAGTYALLFTDGALKPISVKFLVTADASSGTLLLLQTPSPSLTVGRPMLPGPVIKAIDQYGNLLTTDHALVTLSVAGNPSALKGNTTAPLHNGIATFKNLSFSAAGTFVVQASSGSLVNVDFSETVAPAPVALTTPRVSSAGYPAGTTIQLLAKLTSTTRGLALTGTVSVVDSQNNVLGTGIVASNGVVLITLAGLSVGSYTCHLDYPGDLAYMPATSSIFTLTVNPALIP